MRHTLTTAIAAVEVDDSGWPIVVVRTANPAAQEWRVLDGLDRVLACDEPFGLMFHLDGPGRSARPLVEAAMGQRALPIAARCVGAATVAPPGPRITRRVAEHPVLFPFPSVSVPTVEDGRAWIRRRLARASFVRPRQLRPTGGM
jgi:hypothetical protein